MKIKLQINGENPELTGENEEMFDSEYEMTLELSKESLTTLESVLDRAIDNSQDQLFNYQITILQ